VVLSWSGNLRSTKKGVGVCGGKLTLCFGNPQSMVGEPPLPETSQHSPSRRCFLLVGGEEGGKGMGGGNGRGGSGGGTPLGGGLDAHVTLAQVLF